MDEDFARALDKAINGMDKPAIDLSKDKSIYHALQRVLMGTDAGSYLRNLFSETEKSYKDGSNNEVLDLEMADSVYLYKLPIETEMYISNEWTEEVDYRDSRKDSMNGPGYSIGHQENSAYFSIIIHSVEAIDDYLVMQYSYEVERKVNDDWY